MNSVAAKQPYEVQHRLLMPNGSIKWVHERGETSYDASGKPLRSVGTVHDVTERVLAEQLLAASYTENRRALLEKEVLLREVHHRVKNNLQVISSLLHFHLKKTQVPHERSVLEDVRKRLFAMMLVHDKLFRANDLVSVPLGDYARSLLSTLAQSFEGRGRVELVVDAVDVQLPIELALPAGMVLCELVTNVFKHAFPGGKSGRVTLRVEREADRVVMCVDDNGVGFPPDVDPLQTTSFGFHLVRSLVRQLDGTLEIKTDTGSHVCIRFTAPNGAVNRF